MAYATSPPTLDLSAGVLIGFGLAGCSFPMVIGALGKLVPESWRAFAFGAGTAAGSFGQFLFSPLAHCADRQRSPGRQRCWSSPASCCWCCRCRSRWRRRAAEPRRRRRQAADPCKQALTEAFGHRSYVLLVLGFFTCGFQLAFVTVHLPSYLLDRGLARRDRRLDASPSSACSTSSARSARAGSPAGCPSAICCRSSILRRALSIVAFIAAAGDHDDDADLRRGHWACSGSRRCRRPRGSSR